jgi:hypothetical protein
VYWRVSISLATRINRTSTTYGTLLRHVFTEADTAEFELTAPTTGNKPMKLLLTLYYVFIKLPLSVLITIPLALWSIPYGIYQSYKLTKQIEAMDGELAQREAALMEQARQELSPEEFADLKRRLHLDKMDRIKRGEWHQ